MDATELHNTFERIANLLRNESRKAGMAFGLAPVHCEALHYLAICNRYSDTPQGVADYLGLTKGTVSQSLKVLSTKGYLEKTSDPEDRRVIHLQVSPAGLSVLEALIPNSIIKEQATESDTKAQETLLQHLKHFLQTAQQQHQLKAFGVCKSCHYFKKTGSKMQTCGLTQEQLSINDSTKICREYRS